MSDTTYTKIIGVLALQGDYDALAEYVQTIAHGEQPRHHLPGAVAAL
jgi:hypothetical protein